MAEVKGVTITFTAQEKVHLLRVLALGIASYERAQKQRPEFAEVSKQYANELTDLERKVNDSK